MEFKKKVPSGSGSYEIFVLLILILGGLGFDLEYLLVCSNGVRQLVVRVCGRFKTIP